jgi:hypothetical protein
MPGFIETDARYLSFNQPDENGGPVRAEQTFPLESEACFTSHEQVACRNRIARNGRFGWNIDHFARLIEGGGLKCRTIWICA